MPTPGTATALDPVACGVRIVDHDRVVAAKARMIPNGEVNQLTELFRLLGDPTSPSPPSTSATHRTRDQRTEPTMSACCAYLGWSNNDRASDIVAIGADVTQST